MRKTLLIATLAALALLGNGTAQGAEPPKHEMRATWMATVWGIDWPTTAGTSASAITQQKQQMTTYLNRLKRNNMNAVFFQVRSYCDAMYKSQYEPWSSFLAGTGKRGTDPGWDPLAYVVDECHKRGMECHAWINPMRYSTGSNWDAPQDRDLKAKQGWLIAHTSGNTTTTVLNPALPAVRERIALVVKDIIMNYDVDGVIFDDYFYPSGMPTTSAAADWQQWKDSGTSSTFADWRRANVNAMVKAVYDTIQSCKPYVRFGIGPAGVAKGSAAKYGIDVSSISSASDWQYNGIFSDPLAWLAEGSIDYISPQLYWKTDHRTNPFGPLTTWWSNVAKKFGKQHFASHSISFLLSQSNTQTDWAEIAKQIDLSRENTQDGNPGAVLYSTKNVNGSGTSASSASGLGDYLLAHTYTRKALVPAVNWKQTTALAAPQDVQLSGGQLSWKAQEGPLVKHAIYAIPSSVQTATGDDGIKSDYLLDVTYDNTYAVPSTYLTGDYTLAVTAIDAYDNEYAPAYVNRSGVHAVRTSNLRIYATQGQIHITGYAGTVQVFSVAGALLGNYSSADSLAIAPGVYIVKAGSYAQKVAVP